MDALQAFNKAAEGMQNMLQQQSKMVAEIVSKFTDVKQDVTTLRNDIEYLKLETEISTMQCKEISRRIKKKVGEHIKYPSFESQKYYRIYIQYIYRKLRTDYGLGNSTGTTPKRNYESVLKGIDEIIFPDAELREHAEKLYEANLQFKSLIGI